MHAYADTGRKLIPERLRPPADFEVSVIHLISHLIEMVSAFGL